jgi:hypothetical protein
VKSDTRVATLGLVLGLLVAPLVPPKSSAQEPAPPAQDLQNSFPKKPPYSPYAGRHFPERFTGILSPGRLFCDSLLLSSTDLAFERGKITITRLNRGRLRDFLFVNDFARL